MKITPEDIIKYKKEGYLILRDIISLKTIEDLKSFVSHVITLEVKDLVNIKEYDQEKILNELLIKIKRENPSSSSWIYQTILNSYSLSKFFIKINIEKYVMKLLGITNKNNLGIVSPSFRFDIPNDKKNIRTWHQDSNYFLENEKGKDHLVAWIPINKAYKENGSVIISPRSHNKGRIQSDHIPAKKFKSEQYTINESNLDNSDLVYVEAEPGDIAFINMDLIHSSGVNITNNSVRYTAQIRFNTINRKNYRPVFLNPFYPEYERILYKDKNKIKL